MNEDFLPMCTIIIAILFNIPLLLDIVTNKGHKENGEEFVKRIIIAFGGLFASLTFSMLLLMPVSFASEINNNIVLSIYPVVILTYLVIRFIVFFTNYLKVVTLKYDDIYIRDVFVDYSPAVLSLLLNNKIEDKKDFDSTVLNIHAKKAIEFKRVDDKLEIVDLQNQKEIEDLTEDERYIYDVLIQKEKFDKQRWHNIIKEQLDRRDFVKSGKKSVIGQIVKTSLVLFCGTFSLLMLFVLAVLFVPGNLFKNIAINYFDYDIVLSVLWILILIPFQLGALKVLMIINKRKYLKDKMDYYTEKGALEILKWRKFRDFIEDFSMINSANAESVVIWEKYIAYAMAFNINKSYDSNELKKINEIIKEINWFK